MTLAANLKEKYASLPSKKKQWLIMVSIMVFAFLVFWFSVNSGDKQDASKERSAKTSESLTITSDLMEDTLRESVRGETDAINARMGDLEQLVGDLIKRLDQTHQPPAAKLPEQKKLITEKDIKPANELEDLARPEAPRYPPAIAPSGSGAATGDPDLQVNVIQVIGGIGGLKPVLGPGPVAQFVKTGAVIVDLGVEKRLRRHLDIVLSRHVKGTVTANAKICAGCLDQLFSDGQLLALGQVGRLGVEVAGQAVALIDIENPVALEERDALWVAVFFSCSFSFTLGGEAVGIDNGC